MTDNEISEVYGEIVDVVGNSEVPPVAFVQIFATLCVNILKATNIHNNTDIKEATITFDDGGLVIIKLGELE